MIRGICMHRGLLLASVILLASAPALGVCGQGRARGIDGRAAPAWDVSEWINLPENRTRIDIEDFKGKVLYLYCFQSWCPGCHARGFPTLTELIKRYRAVDEVGFVAIQTTFEGFSVNTAEKAWATAKEYDLSIPVGHSGVEGKRSKLMRAYRTGGTPWTIIVDKRGVVRFNDFHITPDRAQRLIDGLRKEEPESSPRSKSKGIISLSKSALPLKDWFKDGKGKHRFIALLLPT